MRYPTNYAEHWFVEIQTCFFLQVHEQRQDHASGIRGRPLPRHGGPIRSPRCRVLLRGEAAVKTRGVHFFMDNIYFVRTVYLNKFLSVN